MNRKKIGALAIIIATFLFGAVGGYSLSTIVSDVEARKEKQSPYGDVSKYVKERLNLNPEQVVIYDELVRERREKMSSIQSTFREQIDSMRNDIRSILTEEQLIEYEQFIEEFSEYRQRKRN